LWFLDYLKSEKELSNFTDKGITAGINNVRLNRECLLFEPVEGFVQKWDISRDTQGFDIKWILITTTKEKL
jgi:hypothetical protein